MYIFTVLRYEVLPIGLHKSRVTEDLNLVHSSAVTLWTQDVSDTHVPMIGVNRHDGRHVSSVQLSGFVAYVSHAAMSYRYTYFNIENRTLKIEITRISVVESFE